MSNRETTEISGIIKRDEPSEDAILFSDGDREEWLPRSQIEVGETDPRTKLTNVTMPEWLAVDRGFA